MVVLSAKAGITGRPFQRRGFPRDLDPVSLWQKKLSIRPLTGIFGGNPGERPSSNPRSTWGLSWIQNQGQSFSSLFQRQPKGAILTWRNPGILPGAAGNRRKTKPSSGFWQDFLTGERRRIKLWPGQLFTKRRFSGHQFSARRRRLKPRCCEGRRVEGGH